MSFGHLPDEVVSVEPAHVLDADAAGHRREVVDVGCVGHRRHRRVEIHVHELRGHMVVEHAPEVRHVASSFHLRSRTYRDRPRLTCHGAV